MSTLTVQNLRGVSPTNQITVPTGHKIYAPGGIVQVVQGLKTDSFATSATITDTPVTGLTATITPLSVNSKILIICELGLTAENYQGGAAKLTRNGSIITGFLSDVAGSRSRSSFAGGGYRGAGTNYTMMGWGLSACHLDSPATTSATTYGVVVSSISVGTYVNRYGADLDQTDGQRFISTITLMEIAQ